MAPFRNNARPCPACATGMFVAALGEQQSVDLCKRCGGAYMDFFDGEPSAIARELTEQQKRAPSKPQLPAPAPLRCPACQIEMRVAPYMEGGPSISRCPRCLAIFASARQLALLAVFVETEEKEKSWLHRVLQAVFSN